MFDALTESAYFYPDNNLRFMKKTIFLISVLLFCCLAPSYSQQRKLPKTGFGLKGGVALTGYNIDGAVHGFSEQLSDPVTGYYGGIVAYWGFRSIPLNIRGEIIYEAAKLKKTYSWGQESTLGITSVSFPVMIGTTVGISDTFGLNLNIGPVFNLISQVKLNGEEQLTTAELFRKPLVGFAAGAGITFWRLTLDVRYNLNPAGRDVEVQSGKNIETMTVRTWGSWNFSLGILF